MIEHPINQRLELTPEQLKTARHRFVFDILFDLLTDAAWADTGNDKQIADMQSRIEQFVTRFVDSNTDDRDCLDVERFFAQVADANGWPDVERCLADPHTGDCTACAMSCPRCFAERMVGIDTVTWKSKGEGHRLLLDYLAKEEAARSHRRVP